MVHEIRSVQDVALPAKALQSRACRLVLALQRQKANRSCTMDRSYPQILPFSIISSLLAPFISYHQLLFQLQKHQCWSSDCYSLPYTISKLSLSSGWSSKLISAFLVTEVHLRPTKPHMFVIFATSQSSLWALEVHFSIPSIMPQPGNATSGLEKGQKKTSGQR